MSVPHANVYRSESNDDEGNPSAPCAEGELNPVSVFAHPMQVVHAKDLTTAEKRAILRSLETDARALQRADDEGMQVGERSRLHDVEIALACLDAKVRIPAKSAAVSD